jgi:hypothetical protein
MSLFYTKESAADYARGKSHFILWNEQDHSFLVYDDVYEYLQGENRPHMHEVILPGDFRKLFFDIDFSINRAGDLSTEEIETKIRIADQHVGNIIAWLIEEMGARYNKNVTRNRIAIVESSGYCGTQHKYYKYSKNIILLDYSFSPTEFILVGNSVRDKYIREGGLDTFIDGKQFSCFSFNNRFVGCTKVGENRYKTCLEFPMPILAITNTENTIKLGKKRKHVVETEEEIAADIQGILDATEHYWADNFAFAKYENNRIIFRRLKPSFCESCQRTHDADNTLRISVKPTHLVIACIKGEKILGSMKWESSVKELPEPEEITTSSPTIADDAFYNNKPIKFIRANMKMGKTKKCREYLESLGDVNIVMISFRRTFTAEILANYRNFTSYEDIIGPIDLNVYNRLIIQVESLYRIIPSSTVKSNCLVLDEVESIWSQFSSSNFIDYHGSSAIFESLYRHSDIVIAMDAHLSDRTERLSKLLSDRPINKYENRHNNTTNPYVFVSEDEWITRLYSLLESGERIAVFTNTLAEAKKITKMAQSITSKVMCYNSETLESIKSLHFSNVNHYWKQYDIIICTPTISAGVSFEEQHFGYVFGYFSNYSCNVETCQQMIGRIRNVGNKIYMYCDKSYIGNYSINVEEIRKYLSERRADAIADLSNAYSIGDLSYSYDADYNAYYHEDFRYTLTVENIAFDNYSRNGFKEHFIALLKKCGYKVIINERIENDADIIANYKGYATQIDDELLTAINEAPLISKEEYDELKCDRIARNDVTMDQLHQMHKYKLTDAFNEPTFEIHTIKKFYKNSNAWRQLDCTRDMLCGEGSWEDRIETVRQIDIQSMARQYDRNGVLDTNQIQYRSDTHRRVKAILDAFVGIDHSLTGFFQFFTGCRLKQNVFTMEELNKFFDIVALNIAHINGNVIKWTNPGTTIERSLARTEKNAISLIIRIMKTVYLCEGRYDKKKSEGKITSCPGICIELDNLMYEGGKLVKKKLNPVIVIRSQ